MSTGLARPAEMIAKAMSSQGTTYLKFGAATVLIVCLLGYLAYTGVQDSKSYYVTISELHKMGNGAYSKRLRVAGNVQPGSIKRVRERTCSLC
jgi:cytochrome c-type biogenesis protein CcmE